jgi:hypothetical protein
MGQISKKITNLHKGLRPSKRESRNSGYLIKCDGVVGRDGVLQALDQVTRMATDIITDPFPYPQIFTSEKVIVVAGQTKIYEWDGAALVEKLTVTAGQTWRGFGSHHFFYMSNGKVAVVRDPLTFEYTITTEQPVASAICDYNSQAIIGSPGVEI